MSFVHFLDFFFSFLRLSGFHELYLSPDTTSGEAYKVTNRRLPLQYCFSSKLFAVNIRMAQSRSLDLSSLYGKGRKGTPRKWLQ